MYIFQDVFVALNNKVLLELKRIWTLNQQKIK